MRKIGTMTTRVKGYTIDGVPYSVYIKSERWAEVKRRYRASKLPQKCVVCGDGRVDLHHKTYKRLGAEYLNDLIPLCRNHHQELHQIVKGRKSHSKGIWAAHRMVRKRHKKRATKKR